MVCKCTLQQATHCVKRTLYAPTCQLGITLHATLTELPVTYLSNVCDITNLKTFVPCFFDITCREEVTDVQYAVTLDGEVQQRFWVEHVLRFPHVHQQLYEHMRDNQLREYGAPQLYTLAPKVCS